MSIRKGTTVIASFVDDSDVVHKTGTETITGNKTFSGNVTFPTTSSLLSPVISKQDSNIEGGEIAFEFADNDSVLDHNVILDVYDGKFRFSSNVNGTIQIPLAINFGTNTIEGTATTALYADLAERYQSDQIYSIGTLIKFGGEKDITIADDKCNGVISENPGFILDNGLEESQPIALVGKTPIRIIGKVNKFDNITLSENPGIGRVAREGEVVIAKALESSEIEEEKLILCITKFNLD